MKKKTKYKSRKKKSGLIMVRLFIALSQPDATHIQYVTAKSAGAGVMKRNITKTEKVLVEAFSTNCNGDLGQCSDHNYSALHVALVEDIVENSVVVDAPATLFTIKHFASLRAAREYDELAKRYPEFSRFMSYSQILDLLCRWIEEIRVDTETDPVSPDPTCEDIYPSECNCITNTGCVHN